MEATGCLLSEAFGEIEDIKIKKKSKKEKKKGQIYPNELKPVDSHFQESSKMIQRYDDHQYYNVNGPSNTYGSYAPIPNQEIINPNIVSVPQVEQKIEHQVPQTIDKPIIQQLTPKEVIDERRQISDQEYNEFKEFQRRKNFEIHQRQLSQLEGFSNVNDDFNDVLLFGLMGIFYLIFTDYIYKLGKKTY